MGGVKGETMRPFGRKGRQACLVSIWREEAVPSEGGLLRMPKESKAMADLQDPDCNGREMRRILYTNEGVQAVPD